MKFFSSAFGFYVAKLHLANYKTAREENQLLRFFITFANADLATVFMLEESLSSSRSFQEESFTEVKCMIGKMYVAITRRGSGGLRPPDVDMVTQISAPQLKKYFQRHRVWNIATKCLTIIP